MSLLERYDELGVADDLTYFQHGDRFLVTNPPVAAFKVLTPEQFAVLTAVARRESPEDLVREHGAAFVDRTLGMLTLAKLAYPPEYEPRVEIGVPTLNIVYYAVTDGCNLRCPYCYASSEHILPGQLSTGESLSLIDEIAAMGAKTLVFTGGEPMLRRDLFELASHAKSIGLKANMITNATLVRTAERARRIADIFTTVTVSLDGATAERNDKTRGEGSFERTYRGLKLLNAAGVTPIINHIVTNENLDELPAFSDFIDSIDVQLVRLMQHSDLGRGATDEYEFSFEDYIAVQHFSWTAPEASKLVPDGKGIRKSCSVTGNCGMGGNEIYITSVGDVYACKLLTEATKPVGNLRESSLADLFGAEQFVGYRSATVGNGHLSDCRRCYIRGACGGGCRAYHSSVTRSVAVNDRGLCRILRRGQVSSFWMAGGVDRAELLEDRHDAFRPRLVRTGEEHPVYMDWTTAATPRRRIPLRVS